MITLHAPENLELPSIGWQLFVLGSSRSDCTVLALLLDTYATRLLTERLKHRFERIRIPLAKMELARRHPTDDPIAYPAINLELGVASQVAEDTFITRRELSDALLDLAGV